MATSIYGASKILGVDRKALVRWMVKLDIIPILEREEGKRQRNLIADEDLERLRQYSLLPEHERKNQYGETNHLASLSDEQVEAVKASNLPLTPLANEIGANRSTISKIRNGQNRKYEGGEAVKQRKITTSERKPKKLLRENVIDIVTSWLPAPMMALKYDISERYVRNLRRVLYWKDVTLLYVEEGGPSW
ncbi:MAG: hypothetical protein QM753_16025 [Thermomicrobiales bacterium]